MFLNVHREGFWLVDCTLNLPSGIYNEDVPVAVDSLSEPQPTGGDTAVEELTWSLKTVKEMTNLVTRYCFIV